MVNLDSLLTFSSALIGGLISVGIDRKHQIRKNTIQITNILSKIETRLDKLETYLILTNKDLPNGFFKGE